MQDSGETELGALHTVLGIMSQKGYYRTKKCAELTNAVKGLEHLFYRKDCCIWGFFQQARRLDKERHDKGIYKIMDAVHNMEKKEGSVLSWGHLLKWGTPFLLV